MGISPHVIVVGNEKGGSGKSTLAIHLSVCLLHLGFKVATIDADSRQQTLTRYVRNRTNAAAKAGLALPHSLHFHLPVSRSDSMLENQASDLACFIRATDAAEDVANFLVIDTPGFDTHLTRLAHALADTLVTPVNDSLIDLDPLMSFDPETGILGAPAQYGRLVQRARRRRRELDGADPDWVVVRNRVHQLSSRNGQAVVEALRQMAPRLGFRLGGGLSERVAFRSWFSAGFTVFDVLEAQLVPAQARAALLGARAECCAVVQALCLPGLSVELGSELEKT